jgi:maltokinase
VSTIDHGLLEDYLLRTRWFAGKSRPFRVSHVRTLAELPGRDRMLGVTVLLVSVTYSDHGDETERYQVPLAEYADVEERLGHAHVGDIERDGRTRHLYDAIHDRDAMALWLDGLIAAGEGGMDLGGLRFFRIAGEDVLDPELRASTLTGEQSNSSVRFDGVAIMKVFRKVSPGINPDIEIHQELTRAGSEHIAALYGWVETDLDGEVLQLAMLQEFLSTAADGFEMATGSVRTLFAEPDQSVAESGGDFAGEAARLGIAIAEVHATMRARFPAEERGSDAARELGRAMHDRLDRALRSVPELEQYAGRLRAAYDAVSALEGVAVQRVHGDLHLGQTLRTAHGWRIVDFEGEPGRPFADRALPDSPWRDVAGMLRSFDYAPAVVEMSLAGQSGGEDDERDMRRARAAEWSRRARDYFLDAYVAALRDADADEATDDAEGAGGLQATQRVLLDAYVADKAVYEAVYEKHNRPSWTGIPLAALAEVGSA